MKKLMVVLILGAMFATPLFASPTVTYNGMGKKGVYSGFAGGSVYAGEMKFTANGIAGVTDGPFTSFCIEADEHVSSGITYDAVLNTGAILGGIGASGFDPLDNGTAWLYNYYLDNVLASSTNTIALDYQMAFWYLEDEITDLNELSAAAQALVATAESHDNVANTNVRVINIYKLGTAGNPDSGDYVQDCLVRISSPVPAVPAPGAILLGGIGVSLVGWLRRRHTV